MPNILNTFNITEIRAVIAEKPKTLAKKIKSQKIKKKIKVAIISTKVACITKTLVINLTFHNLIVQ